MHVEREGFRVENVSMRYGKRPVLSNISCHLDRGRNWAITGASGCGKSTILRLLAGLEPPEAGTIYLNGNPVSADGKIMCPASQRHVSMVFQDLALWPNLTAVENVLLGLKGGRIERSLALECLEICGILSLSGKYPYQMSGGEQQRLALARALAARPDFLFLDEPFSGLDIAMRNSIIESIKGLVQREGIDIVLVSHDPYEVLCLCDSIIVIERGGIAEQGRVADLFDAPGSEVMKNFSQYIKRLRQGV